MKRKTIEEVLQKRELGRLSFTHTEYEMLLDTPGEMQTAGNTALEFRRAVKPRKVRWEYLHRMVFKNRRLRDVHTK